jgi:hypothetical protein
MKKVKKCENDSVQMGNVIANLQAQLNSISDAVPEVARQRNTNGNLNRMLEVVLDRETEGFRVQEAEDIRAIMEAEARFGLDAVEMDYCYYDDEE